MKKFISLFLSIALAVSVLMLSGCSGSTENNKDDDLKEAVNSGSYADYKDIDLKEAVKITMGGSDGSGYAEVTLDNVKLKDLLDDVDTELAFRIIGSLDIAKIENNGQLSNGENINIKIKYSDSVFEKAKLNAVNSEFQYEISGLAEKEKKDVFENVELVIIPVSDDETKCKLSVYYNDNYVVSEFNSRDFEITGEDGNTVTYEDRDNVYFNRGETVTVSLTEKIIEDKSYRYDFTVKSKEYVVNW